MKFKYKDHDIELILPDDRLGRKTKERKSFLELSALEMSLPYIDKKSVVVDVGANIGNHTVFFGLFCKKVIAFEPFENNFELLKQNVKLNNINAELHNMVILNEVGKSSIEEKGGHCGAIKFKRDDLGKYGLNTLDNLIKEKVDFIKIDVEGGELKVLKGAVGILKTYHPILGIEIHRQWDKLLGQKCITFLKKHGYKKNRDFFLKPKRRKKKK